ncbi:MAG: calcium-binding protein, partial [Gammaproteobacteria bacterium]|nr:calcium-binding protein [Gammaproteobacteria bacterium]
MEIVQELTLERQAFEAHVRIKNGLSHITLEDVSVGVNFLDEEGNPVEASSDPESATATFFIRLDSTEHVDNLQMDPNTLDFTGTVSPSSSAELYWLIIPAPGSSDGEPQGKLYYVDATLTYTIGGEEQVTEVTPDYIFVTPMPELYLDYFLPNDVYGDDAWTPETEAPVPFSLGMRVRNQGFGAAWNLKIDSAQPKIVDNEQGLLVDVLITGSEV